jgi:outer membrane protein insertion porin family
LLGKGQDLRLGLSLGTLSTLIDLSFTEPYFLDRAVAAGFDLFRTSNDRQAIASYSDASIGFALRAAWAYTEHTRQTVRYSLRQTDIYNVPSFASAIVQSQQGFSVTSEIAESVSWDTRDQRLNPTKGHLLRHTVALGGPPGDNYYVRITGDAVYYQQLFEDVIASVGGGVGVILPYNNTIPRLNNLFFIGGDTLRGFAVGGIGPRDANTGDALGGLYYYTGTSELSVPMPFIPKELGLFGKAFIDIGSLWGTVDNTSIFSILDSTIMRIGTGVGVQWISPFGPIRVDYAVPVQQAPFDKTQNFRFSFGTRF